MARAAPPLVTAAWTGLGVHDPYNDNHEYHGNFSTERFSQQWRLHESKGWLPWCYTYGKCVGDYGLDFTVSGLSPNRQ